MTECIILNALLKSSRDSIFEQSYFSFFPIQILGLNLEKGSQLLPYLSKAQRWLLTWGEAHSFAGNRVYSQRKKN